MDQEFQVLSEDAAEGGSVVVLFRSIELAGSTFSVEMRLSVHIAGPTSVRVTSEEGAPVTGSVLRALRLAELAQAGQTWLVESDSKTLGRTVTLSDAERTRLRAQGPTEETLRWVADIYNKAQRVGKHPTRQVQIELGDVPRPTVSVWVRKARERGLILQPVSSSRGAKWSVLPDAESDDGDS